MTQALGVRYSTEPEQFRHARLILAWGANILGTNVHLWPFIVAARRRGAKFYVIDPVLTRTGRLADKHFPVNPGSDLALALGLMHVILAEGLEDKDYIARYTTGFDSLKELAGKYPPERAAALTGISKEEIIELAREYATAQPSVIRLNYGIQRSERGGAAVRAVAMLPALTGSWRHAGGGMQLSTSGGFRLDRDGLERADLQKLSPLGREARLVNMVELGKVLTQLDSPPVKALVVYCSNPGAGAPNQNLVLQGMRREDLFTVVLEQFQTDTADYADILLPVTTFLEHTDIYFAYGHYYLQMAKPVLPAAGEAKSNVEVFRSLAERMGFSEPCFRESEEDMIRGLLASGHRFLEGITLERLEREHFVRLNIARDGEPFLPFAQGRFETPSGKCNLDATGLDYTPPGESRLGDTALRAMYPLELVSAKADSGLNSTFGNRDDIDAETAVVAISAADASERGIRTGERVRLFNSRGSLLLRAQVSDEVQQGVVSNRSVRWAKRAEDGRNSNALTSDRLTDMGGGAVFYSCLVQVERCEQ